ncbi:putative metal-dependent HD superfamily phosphohydrolase [Saccharothrix carnea]|uniref:Putative metal-dependent HD superfamily phosphohydrolase n=1 Tax=Saccharothrix carnea TaxID=1280637 RepID=A0A2P8IEM5_SACCR|nr:HD domain-containing protein [Saccharothrix carnea]PSL56903.1 putative metal-dependent HD superfamily phosphohydrolase [Saccharothrix carnea]
MRELERRWHEAVRELGGTQGPGDLVDRYAEPHRGYHNGEHVLAVVRDVNVLAADRTPRERAVLTLAALVHDVIYDGVPGEDERRSAEWARAQLAGLPEADEVASLVLATAEHTSDDPLTCLLLDADLAVLGSAPATYERYRTAVRAEYAHVPDDAWRVGRAKVLRSLAGRDPLYATPHARARWEARAKANLAAELSSLGDPP